MKAPKKVITAMAIASLLGSGVVTAHAADFETIVENGKETLQRTEKYNNSKDAIAPEISNQLKANGDIKISGTFTKSVNSFPSATQEGRYLRITMPLELNYQYNLDNNEMVSGKGTITNESVFAKMNDEQQKIVEEKQPVRMTFMGLVNNTQNEDIQYVESANEQKALESGKVQVPFGLVIKKGENDVQTISLASMQSIQNKDGENSINPIVIGAGASLEVKIGKLGEQEVANAKALNGKTASISHNMKLRFEYVGN